MKKFFLLYLFFLILAFGASAKEYEWEETVTCLKNRGHLCEIGGEKSITGYVKVYNGDGVLWEKRGFKDGDQKGITKTYKEGEILECETNYATFLVKDGPSKCYYKNGSLKSESNYENNILKSDKRYGEDGKLEEENIYKNDERFEITYFENGNVKTEQTYKTSKLEGFSKRYNENGTLRFEGNYKAGELDGLAKEYDENGILQAEKNYKEGKREGYLNRYWDNGALWEKSNYQNDRAEGQRLYYNQNGTLSGEENYKNGELDGVRKNYDENGNLIDEENYKEGKQNGPEKKYNDKGQLDTEVIFKDDKIEKFVKYENGRLAGEMTFENGEAVSAYAYDSQGKKRVMSQDEIANFMQYFISYLFRLGMQNKKT